MNRGVGIRILITKICMKIINSFLILIVFLSGCREGSENKLESKDISLIFETEFEYILEDPRNVNFYKTLDLNEIKNARINARLWKQDLSIVSNPELYLESLLERKILVDSVIEFQVNPKWLPVASQSLMGLFEIVDTTIRFFEIQTTHRYGGNIGLTNYKIKQKWYYNESSNKLSNEVISISPIFITKKEFDGAFRKPDTIIWFKEERINIPMYEKTTLPFDINNLLNNRDIVWIKQITSDLSFENVEILKGNKTKFNQIFWDDIINFNTLAYVKEGIFEVVNRDTFDNQDLEEMMSSSMDTIVNFDPITYDEIVLAAEYIPPIFESIQGFRINQIWYFDTQSNQLNSKLISVGPLVKDHFYHHLEALYFIPCFDYTTK